MTHTFPIRVYYEDSDADGIVYHANYLKFAERARTELLREQGFEHYETLREHNLVLVVYHIEVFFKVPARLGDLLEVRTETVSCNNTAIILTQTIGLGDKAVAEVKSTIVGMSPDGKPMRLSPQLRQIFAVPPAAK